jgi:hypothetical protein
MDLLVLGFLIGVLVGFIAGGMYDHWKVERIVDTTILKYRVDEQKRRTEMLRKFIDEEDGEEGGE